MHMRVAVIGSGNVATHLVAALDALEGVSVTQIISRNVDHARRLAGRVGAEAGDDVGAVDNAADFVIISTADAAIAYVASRLPRLSSSVVVHTSGSVPIDVLNRVSDRVGVLYPLQTFSRTAYVDISGVPFFTEASDDVTLAEIDALAGRLSSSVTHADSRRRRVLHIAGVLACNFPTYLFGCTERILAAEGLGLDVVKPLVKTTIAKCFDIGPCKAQTGPARRGDAAVVAAHIEALPDDIKGIYRTLSQSIMTHFADKEKKDSIMSKIAYDLTKIRGIVFDVDGVLSPSTIPMGDNGVPQRMANLKDGYALQLAVKKGLKIAIITGADTEAIRVRFNALGITDIYTKAAEKLPVLELWMDKEGLKPDEVAYVGDDIPDIRPMEAVGLSVAPDDAAPDVKYIARFISTRDGGQGVARELLEEIMRAQGLWMTSAEAFGW